MKNKHNCLNCAFFCARICKRKNGHRSEEVVQTRTTEGLRIQFFDETNRDIVIPYCYPQQWTENEFQKVQTQNNDLGLMNVLNGLGKKCLLYEEHENNIKWDNFKSRLERFRLNKDIEAANTTEKGVKISKMALCISIGFGVLSVCMACILHGFDSKQLDKNTEQIVYAISSIPDKLNEFQQQTVEITKGNISITTSSYPKD